MRSKKYKPYFGRVFSKIHWKPSQENYILIIFYFFQILMTRTNLLIRYILLINVVTFIIRWVDKYKATAQKRRISEKNLLIFTALGWWLGAVLGMQAFRHKTIKGKFLTKFRLIAGLWIVLTIVLLFSM